MPEVRKAVHQRHQGETLWPWAPGETCSGGRPLGVPQLRPCWAKPMGRFRGRVERAELAAIGVSLQDYELQLVTYKAQLEPVASPAKKPKVQSGSESVIQEVRLRGSGAGGWAEPKPRRAWWALGRGRADCGCPSAPSMWTCGLATVS